MIEVVYSYICNFPQVTFVFVFFEVPCEKLTCMNKQFLDCAGYLPRLGLLTLVKSI